MAAKAQDNAPPTASTSSNTATHSERDILHRLLTSGTTKNISSLGVLLETLHLASYDLSRAESIARLVSQSPPAGPSSISQSRTDESPSTHTSAHSLTASAAAASQGSVAAVAVTPNGAATAVGTATSTSSSTAVPFSDVTSLPEGAKIVVAGGTTDVVVQSDVGGMMEQKWQGLRRKMKGASRCLKSPFEPQEGVERPV